MKFRRRAIFLRRHSQKSGVDHTPKIDTSFSDNMAQHVRVGALQGSEEHLTNPPSLQDSNSTATTRLQEKTVQECLPLLNAINLPTTNPFDFDENGLPFLDRESHIEFLQNGLGDLPPQFVAMDASRPWLMYWSLMSFYLLKRNSSHLHARLLKTFQLLQSKSGGFGGGQGHFSHLACTYAVILAVAITQDESLYKLLDRRALYRWLGQLKHRSGGFRICDGGEIDVRGAYCSLVAITLLDLPWELPNDSPAREAGLTDFRDGLGAYISRCQGYEGGISAGPSNEAHGAYAFCAMACLCLLGRPQETLPKYLDLPLLIRWLSERQYAPEGGFAGRTNKVVDGCYSHWIGTCWPLVEAALNELGADPLEVPRLFDHHGLCRYILSCCQAPHGGLRDKPSKRPDTYHTCYNLVGLSMASHRQCCTPEINQPADLRWNIAREEHVPSWDSTEDSTDDSSSSPAYDPVYVIAHEAVRSMRTWSRAQGFSET